MNDTIATENLQQENAAPAEGLGTAVRRGLEDMIGTDPATTEAADYSTHGSRQASIDIWLEQINDLLEGIDRLTESDYLTFTNLGRERVKLIQDALLDGDFESGPVVPSEALGHLQAIWNLFQHAKAHATKQGDFQGLALLAHMRQELIALERGLGIDDSDAPTGRQPLTLGDFETDPHRNPLIDSDPSETASNIHNALQYMHSADAHIAQSSVLGETTEDGRFRLMDCIEWATRALAADLSKIQAAESK